MKIMARCLVISVLCAFAVPALAGGECCDKAKAVSGWCGDCKVGYVGGVEVKSKVVYNALAGAPAPMESKCEGCRKAMASNGRCDGCGVSFADKKMYRSPFSWALAKGSYKAESDFKCDGCKKLCKDGGWCESCKQGVIHGFVFKDRKEFDSAMKAHVVVQNSCTAKCEGCAVAMSTNGKCAACNATYLDGKKVASADKKEAVPSKP